MGFWGDIKRDFKAVFRNDPAARNGLEVILAYPGFHAIVIHRINHYLWRAGIPVIPRLISHIARFFYWHRDTPRCKDRSWSLY